jgi:hypothetical protein
VDPLDRSRTHAYAGPNATPVAVKTSLQDQTPAPPIYDLIGNAQEWALDPSWREDASGKNEETWVRTKDTMIGAIRGLPLDVEPPPAIPATGAAYREQLCATGLCADKGVKLRPYVGFRCARPTSH